MRGRRREAGEGADALVEVVLLAGEAVDAARVVQERVRGYPGFQIRRIRSRRVGGTVWGTVWEVPGGSRGVPGPPGALPGRAKSGGFAPRPSRELVRGTYGDF